MTSDTITIVTKLDKYIDEYIEATIKAFLNDIRVSTSSQDIAQLYVSNICVALYAFISVSYSLLKEDSEAHVLLHSLFKKRYKSLENVIVAYQESMTCH